MTTSILPNQGFLEGEEHVEPSAEDSSKQKSSDGDSTSSPRQSPEQLCLQSRWNTGSGSGQVSEP